MSLRLQAQCLQGLPLWACRAVKIETMRSIFMSWRTSRRVTLALQTGHCALCRTDWATQSLQVFEAREDRAIGGRQRQG